MNITDSSGRLIGWSLCLSEYDLEIKYKKGKNRNLADAVLRLSTSGKIVDVIEKEIPCCMAEPTDATEAEEKYFERLDHISALEEGAAADRLGNFQSFASQ